MSTNSNPEISDLVLKDFPEDLEWGDGKAPANLEAVFAYVNLQCDSAVSWYYAKKRSKRILGYMLRLFAIISIAVAGVIPVVGEIYENNEIPIISPAWATVALAVGALLITVDRFGGYTTGWVRFVRTAQALTALKSKYQIEWEKSRAATQESEETAKYQDQFTLCHDYLSRVNAIVQTETDEWAREFQSVLTELDKQTKDKNGTTP